MSDEQAVQLRGMALAFEGDSHGSNVCAVAMRLAADRIDALQAENAALRKALVMMRVAFDGDTKIGELAALSAILGKETNAKGYPLNFGETRNEVRRRVARALAATETEK